MPVLKACLKILLLLGKLFHFGFGGFKFLLIFFILIRRNFTAVKISLHFFILILQFFQLGFSLVNSRFQGRILLLPLRLIFKRIIGLFLNALQLFELVLGVFDSLRKQFLLLRRKHNRLGIEFQRLVYLCHFFGNSL